MNTNGQPKIVLVVLFATLLGLCAAIVPVALAGDTWALWPVKLSPHQEMIATFTMILGPAVGVAVVLTLLVTPHLPQPPRGRKPHPAVSFGQFFSVR